MIEFEQAMVKALGARKDKLSFKEHVFISDLIKMGDDYTLSVDQASYLTAIHQKVMRKERGEVEKASTKKPTKSQLEATFELHLKATKLTGWVPEYRFHDTRRWRFDFAFPELKIAVELEGGLYSHGKKRVIRDKRTGLSKTVEQKSRHLTPKGFEDDCRKYGEAAIMGWRVIRVPAGLVYSGEAITMIERAIENGC